MNVVLSLQEAGWSVKDTLELPMDRLVQLIELSNNKNSNVKHVTADEYIKMFGVTSGG